MAGADGPLRDRLGFQTLIGTVKGRLEDGGVGVFLMFQTLIGTVKGLAVGEVRDRR